MFGSFLLSLVNPSDSYTVCKKNKKHNKKKAHTDTHTCASSQTQQCVHTTSNNWQSNRQRNSKPDAYCTCTHAGSTAHTDYTVCEELTGGVEDTRWGWGETLSQQSVVRRRTRASLQYWVCQEVVAHGRCKIKTIIKSAKSKAGSYRITECRQTRAKTSHAMK